RRWAQPVSGRRPGAHAPAASPPAGCRRSIHWPPPPATGPGLPPHRHPPPPAAPADPPQPRSTKPEEIMADHGFTTGFATARTATMAAALPATIGLAAASWVVAVWQLRGMDMGVATSLGSFAFFIAVWVAMMAAMMLPGAAPAVLRRAHASGRVRAVPLFIGSYLAVWALVGVAVYALYRPHGPV